MWFEKPSQKLTENITEHTPQRDNMAYCSLREMKIKLKYRLSDMPEVSPVFCGRPGV